MLEISFQKLIGRADRGNPDGWGAVFYEKYDAYVFREPRPASDSRLASLLGQCGVESHLIISHIRRATTGSIELKNTHSFTREIQGRLHSFAFNGNVHDVFELELLMDRFSPIGETDGEFAFSWILEQLMIEAVDGNWKDTAAVLQSYGTQLVDMGPANFCIPTAYTFMPLHRDGPIQTVCIPLGYIFAPGSVSRNRRQSPALA